MYRFFVTTTLILFGWVFGPVVLVEMGVMGWLFGMWWVPVVVWVVVPQLFDVSFMMRWL